MNGAKRWIAAVLIAGTSLLALACAARMGALDFPYAQEIRCAVPAQQVTQPILVINSTGGQIQIPGGHSLIVPAGALPTDSAVFRYVVPPSNRVLLNITAKEVAGGTIHNFLDSLTLTMGYAGRQCTMANGSPLDTAQLDIYRTNPAEENPLPKVAAVDSTITTKIISLSTFAIAN